MPDPTDVAAEATAEPTQTESLDDFLNADTDAEEARLNQTEQNNPAPTGDNQTPDNASPDGQPGKQDEAAENAATEPEKTKRTLPDDASVREALGLKATEAQTSDHWKSRYDASSTEARALVAREKAVSERLAELGMQLVDSKGKIELLATDDAVKDFTEKHTEDVVRSLTSEELAMGVDRPADLAKLIMAKLAPRLSATPNATITQDDIRIGDSAAQEATEQFAIAKDSEGNPIRPNWDIYEPYIHQTANDVTTPDWFRDGMTRSKEDHDFALSLLHAKVDSVVGPQIRAMDEANAAKAATNAAKENKAAGEPSLASEGTLSGKNVAPSKGRTTESDEADEIVNASPLI